MRQEYAAIRDRYQPGQTVVLTLGVTLGARLSHDGMGIPAAMLVPFPEWLRSVYDERTAPGRQNLRVAIKRLLHGALNWRMTSLLAPDFNRFRGELGLPPLKQGLARWIYPPQLIVGMFPEWYAGYRPDWPSNVSLTGFPIFDGGEATELAPAVEQFLAAGTPPVVFNALSAFQNAREFFEIGVAAVRKMNRRAILLSQFPENVPPELPHGIAHFKYVPHSVLLPRAAAIVHQGGIGTTAKALLAAIPQIIVPVNFDQPFNGKRVASLGVGSTLEAGACSPERLSKELEALLTAPAVVTKLGDYSARVRSEDGTEQACRLIEDVFVHGRQPSRAIGA
jgi:UDP:flavonoid glycosyltransferase YjiC (YdhE family)